MIFFLFFIGVGALCASTNYTSEEIIKAQSALPHCMKALRFAQNMSRLGYIRLCQRSADLECMRHAGWVLKKVHEGCYFAGMLDGRLKKSCTLCFKEGEEKSLSAGCDKKFLHMCRRILRET